MTSSDGLGRDVAGGGGPLSASQILVLCDRVVNEFGRRAHLFAWLRAPDGGSRSWLPVDAYYPASRLVVIVRESPSPVDALFRELVPAHGLRLLWLVPQELPNERSAAEAALARALGELSPPPPRASERPLAADGPGGVAQALSALAQAPGPTAARLRVGQSQHAAAERAARFVAAHPTAAAPRPARAGAPPRIPPRPPPPPVHHPRSEPEADRDTLGVMVGLVLVAVIAIEVYAGVTRAGIDAGRVLLAFGLALDACARALGTIAAGHTGDRGWAWACALGGSPLVASFVMFREEGPVTTDPAPLAGLLALLAMAAAGISILASAL